MLNILKYAFLIGKILSALDEFKFDKTTTQSITGIKYKGKVYAIDFVVKETS